MMGASRTSNDEPFFYLGAGSMIGTVRHHGLIPWDDDVDIYVKSEHMTTFLNNVMSLGLSVAWTAYDGNPKHTGKIFNASLPSISNQNTHSYPFVDVFTVDCSDGLNCIEQSVYKRSFSIDSIYPLKRRPFGRLSMPFPSKSENIVKEWYGSDIRRNCTKFAYNHRFELFLGRSYKLSMNCSDIPVPFVSSQNENDGRPWSKDFPSLSVEHLLNSDKMRLSSVVYDDGREIRRSFAEFYYILKLS